MTQPGRFNCQSCGADFQSREQLEEHNSRQHRGVPTGPAPGPGGGRGYDPSGGEEEGAP